MVLAIVGAVTAVASATAAVVKTVEMKEQGKANRRQAARMAHQEAVQAMRQGARDRLAASRVAIVKAQAGQAQLLAEASKANNRLLVIGVGSSLLILTVIGLRRK